MASRSASLPHRKPMPVGPHILCPDAATKSTPSSCTSTGMCGRLWQASSSTSASTACAAATISRTGATQPSVFETCASATSFVRGVISAFSASRSRLSLASSGANLILKPRSLASICHGTRLEWCSITVRMISSPSPRFVRPHVCATRLIASVAPRVKITSDRDAALMKPATLSRAPSYESVERTESRCAPRCTLALSFCW
mmetsp:Transcript_44379/g.106626  ORF Transcript_44379/g.106626 Transcript_44379/m.106626 type:complete len:201 (+) Transcript_44379:548-1150(+)